MRSMYLILAGIIVLLLVFLLSFWPATAIMSSGYTITSWTTSGGGGTSTAAGYSLTGVIGQPAVGEMSGGGFTVSSGYLSGVVSQPAQPAQPYQAYLPMVKH